MRCLLHGIVLEKNIVDPSQEMKLIREPMFWRTTLEGKVQERG
jgi:hypothetical protein